MFTGIITARGSLTSLRHRGSAIVLTIDLGQAFRSIVVGESISVSGVCLTVCRYSRGIASFDVSEETLKKTTIGNWRAGTCVNLERALSLGDRLGGHLVYGHVDGIGTLKSRTQLDGSERFIFRIPRSVTVIEKGSLAIDGVSLTTFDCRPGYCAIAVIPHTFSMTTLADLQVGSSVNLEQDPIGQWVAAMVVPHRRR